MTHLPSLSRLRALLPPDRVLTDAATLAVHDADAQTAYRCRGLAVVTPATTEEVIITVRWCHREGVPFVVRGSGTGLCAGATPVAAGIVIVTTRLNRIRELDPVRRLAVVEPGVVNLDISRAAAPHGLFYAPDPSSQPVCTIGGNVGFNAGGAHCLKHGMTSNHVLGLRAVLATGEVVDWNTDSREILGPGWSGLFVGNEGLFGVALEITVNLMPKPEGCFTVLAGFTSSEHAGATVSAIIAAGIVPVAMELMDALTIEAVRPVVAVDYPPDCQALLVIELDGPAAIVATDQIRLEALLRTQQATGWVVARDAASRAAIWKVRKSAYSAYGRLAPSNMVQDCVVPRRHLGTALRRIDELAAAAGLRCANICHAGDGNIHPNLLHDGSEPGAHARVEHLAGEILEACIALGGSITGEHGVGIEKRPYLSKMYGPAEIDLFHRIRAVYDPQQLANPGKMLLPATAFERPAGAAATVAASPSPSELPAPTSIDELVDLVRATPRLLPVGARTKPALSAVEVPLLSLRHLRGITDYAPDEFVLTASAGTTLTELNAALAAAGQALPFDAPFAAAGATLGGTVATALSGPGRFRHGSVRDAVIGMTTVDGLGQRLQLGSRVVKNVAGFDLPKFLCGSLGRYAILTTITLKVVPRREGSVTFFLPFADDTALLATLAALARSPGEPEAIETCPADGGIRVRFAAPFAALDDLTTGFTRSFPEARRLAEEEAAAFWAQGDAFAWVPPGTALVKIPTSLARAPHLLAWARVRGLDALRLGAAGDVAFAAVPAAEAETARQALAKAGFGSLLLRGSGPPLVGVDAPGALADRLKSVFDPHHRFPAPLA